MILTIKISKTKNEIKFPIYGQLNDFLRQELSDVMEQDNDTLLFTGYSVSRLGRRFRRLKARLGITDRYKYTLKTFRKSFATRMSAILDIQYVSYLLAHDKPETSFKYYSEILVDQLRHKINEKSIN